jgi:hypothetical protein
MIHREEPEVTRNNTHQHTTRESRKLCIDEGMIDRPPLRSGGCVPRVDRFHFALDVFPHLCKGLRQVNGPTVVGLGVQVCGD